MARPPKHECERRVKRHLSVPPDLDPLVEQDAELNHEGNYSAAAVKRIRWTFNKDLTQNDLQQENAGNKNGR